MRSLLIACIMLIASAAQAQTVTTITVTTAQDAAVETARRGVVGHCTRRPGGIVEGVGFSPVSEEDAVRRCCFWGKRKVREIGVARGARGWYAVVWYY